ncbi:MAG: AbrB/MazE/SpoVT family DNA-binding domain-containing protein [Patulibacter sp.]
MRISAKNQITLPVDVMRRAGVRAGDDVVARVSDKGEIVLAVRGARVRKNAGIVSGLYRSDEVDRLRVEWER